MSDIYELQARVIKFIEDRDWRQFHDDPKNTLIALASEVGELMDIYRFTTAEEARNVNKSRKQDVEDELGDILYLLLMFAEQNDFDIVRAFNNKEKQREAKYPIDKFKGVNKKYDK
ncbi:MAG: MazG nucleotide pyrophosphohydrolase domain-containing protein [Candidatus Saccharimonadales bacterium]